MRNALHKTLETGLAVRLAPRLERLAQTFAQVSEGTHAITSVREMREICEQVTACAQDARVLEAASLGRGYVNEAAVTATGQIRAAEEMIQTARRLLVERHDRWDADPAGKVSSGLTMAIAELERARDLVCGARAPRS